MYRTCLIQLATDIPTSKLSNYNTRGERERERKSRLRLAFCPGSLPAIRRVNAANARWLHSYTHTRHQRCEIIARNNARSSSIFDVRIIEPDGKEPPDGKILSSSSSSSPLSPPWIDVSYASNINFPPVFEYEHGLYHYATCKRRPTLTGR